MNSTGKNPESIAMLLRAGADVHAVDQSGNSVATFFPKDGPLRELLEKHDGGRPLVDADDFLQSGREDWLIIKRDPSANMETTAILPDHPPLQHDKIGSLSIRINNTSNMDRVVGVKARLNGAVLFIDASHEGAIEDPIHPQLQQTIRWPLLGLPAHSQGRLAFRVITLPEQGGDIVIDVTIRDTNGREEVLNLHQPAAVLERQSTSQNLNFLILTLLLIAGVIWFLIRRRSQTASTAQMLSGFAAFVCAGFAILLVLSIIDPFVRFEEATCTLLDRRIQLKSSQTGSGSKTGRSLYSVPLAAVRIDYESQRFITTGFPAGIGIHSVDEFRRFPLGASSRCWVYSEDPTIFTLDRTPAIGMILGILFLGLFSLALAAFAWRKA
jgi:hypothetical protein